MSDAAILIPPIAALAIDGFHSSGKKPFTVQVGISLIEKVGMVLTHCGCHRGRARGCLGGVPTVGGDAIEGVADGGFDPSIGSRAGSGIHAGGFGSGAAVSTKDIPYCMVPFIGRKQKRSKRA